MISKKEIIVAVLVSLLICSCLCSVNNILVAGLDNLMHCPNDWWTYDNAPNAFTGNTHVDSEVTYGTPSSIRLEDDPVGTNLNREVDGIGVSVHGGDRIVFQARILTGAGQENTWGGARIGIDFYTANSTRITAIQSDGAHGVYPNEEASAVAAFYVDWASSGWVNRVIDFTVPSMLTSDGSPLTEGTTWATTACICWLQVWDNLSNGATGESNTGHVWFADTHVYVYENYQVASSGSVNVADDDLGGLGGVLMVVAVLLAVILPIMALKKGGD